MDTCHRLTVTNLDDDRRITEIFAHTLDAETFSEVINAVVNDDNIDAARALYDQCDTLTADGVTTDTIAVTVEPVAYAAQFVATGHAAATSVSAYLPFHARIIDTVDDSTVVVGFLPGTEDSSFGPGWTRERLGSGLFGTQTMEVNR